MESSRAHSISSEAASDADPFAPLVARVAGGDAAALRALYDATSAHVFGLASRILCDREAIEETVVIVYAQVWKQAQRHDATRGSVLSWITNLARTRAIDVRRRYARRVQNETRLVRAHFEALQDPAPDPFEASHGRERIGRVQRALERLPPDQRRAIDAAFYGGLSHSEVASALGLPLGTIKTRIRSGLASLRQALATVEGERA